VGIAIKRKKGFGVIYNVAASPRCFRQ